MQQPHLPSPALSPFPPSHPDAARDPARVRAELEAQLLTLAQDLYEMEVCAGEVGQGQEDRVPQYLAKVNQALANLSAMAPHITDSVPRTVVENVDRYRNPHLFTKSTMSRATGENQYALGRLLGLESFRRQLHDGISEAFPTVPLPERRHKPLNVPEEEEEEVKPEPAEAAEVEESEEKPAMATTNGEMEVDA